MNSTFEKLTPVVLLLARIVIGYMFLLHGTAKFFEYPMSMTGGNGAVTDPMMIVGGILEIAGQMAYAYFFMHVSAETIFNPLANKGELAIMYCMAFLIFMVIGPGKLSLDAKRSA